MAQALAPVSDWLLAAWDAVSDSVLAFLLARATVQQSDSASGLATAGVWEMATELPSDLQWAASGVVSDWVSGSRLVRWMAPASAMLWGLA